MSDNKISSELDTTAQEVWPRKLNKLLIGIGVLAFGLIIVDRLSNMFEADDLPAVVDVQTPLDTPDATLSQAVEPLKLEPDSEESGVESDAGMSPSADSLNFVQVFGGSLVFVSASEPAYVITENDVRIDVGGQLSDDFTLAGVTGDRVILEKSGELVSIALPDPEMQ